MAPSEDFRAGQSGSPLESSEQLFQVTIGPKDPGRSEALEEAIARHGKPEIVNTDQGSQFTGTEFIGKLNENGIAISMDGKGCWRDNVFIERFWRTVKYEEVYLRAYETVSQARESIARYIAFYNGLCGHSSLQDRTPDAAYFGVLEMKTAA